MNKKLDRLLTKYEKKYNAQKASKIIISPCIRTGVYPLDYVLDGGIHQSKGGHMIEFYGAESSGKTSFALLVIKKFQELDKTCVYINAENSYDPVWAEILGVDNDNILIVKPETLEDGGDLLTNLILEEADLVVIDSIIALMPEEEVDKDLKDKTMASQAKVISPMTRKIYKAIANRQTVVIFINQLREKVGQRYGNPETTGGGRAIRHMYHTRVRFKTGAPIKVGSGKKEETIGMEINLWGKKNKKGVAYRKGVIEFYANGQLNNKECLFFSGLKYDIIQLSGKTYTYKNKKVVGQEKFKKLLTDKDYKTIEEEIWKRIK